MSSVYINGIKIGEVVDVSIANGGTGLSAGITYCGPLPGNGRIYGVSVVATNLIGEMDYTEEIAI